MNTKKIETLLDNRRTVNCTHPSLTREWITETALLFGAPTENYVCAHCGLQLSSILRGSRR